MVKYWPGQFKINYVTTYSDGAVSDRTFEWQDPVESHSEMLKRKLQRTSRDNDREAIKLLLGPDTDFTGRYILDTNWANLDTQNVNLTQ